MTAPSTRPSEAQLESLRWVAGSTLGLGVVVDVGALRALLDDYEARGTALRDIAEAARPEAADEHCGNKRCGCICCRVWRMAESALGEEPPP